MVAETYGVGKSKISHIKKNKEKILNFLREISDMGMQKKAKITKITKMYSMTGLYFCGSSKKRMEGVSIIGPIL